MTDCRRLTSDTATTSRECPYSPMIRVAVSEQRRPRQISEDISIRLHRQNTPLASGCASLIPATVGCLFRLPSAACRIREALELVHSLYFCSPSLPPPFFFLLKTGDITDGEPGCGPGWRPVPRDPHRLLYLRVLR